MNINRNRPRLPHTGQKGAALVIAMILLTIITLLSVSAMRTTNLDTKIAVNHQFKELSFQAAESALAQVTVPEAEVQIPNSVDGASADNPEYFDTDDVYPGQTPRLTADLRMDFLFRLKKDEVPDTSKGEINVLASGYSINSGVVSYMATATGHVGENKGSTQTVNRSQVILFTQ